MTEQTVYEAVGGMPWFESLIERFYGAIEHDFLLRPLYPDDLADSRDHMVKFLAQYWGGPTTYSEERGHPRLRMRHAPFVITLAERNAWFGHMRDAVHAGELPPELEKQMLDYFDMAATSMINTV